MADLKTRKIFEANHTATQARWIYIALVFAIGIITKISGVSNVMFPMQLIVALFCISVASNSFWYLFHWFSPEKNDKKAKTIYRITFIQYLLDLAIITTIIHFAGGIESISFIFYFFVIVASSFVYDQKKIFFISLAAIFLYDVLIFSEYFQVINAYSRYNFSNLAIHNSFDVVAVNAFTVSMALFTTALFIGYLSRLRRIQEDRLISEKDEKFRETKKTEEIRSRFITILTHQLRTPLTHIKLALSSFSESKEISSESNQKLLLEADLSVERILALVDRLVKIKDLESKKVYLEKDIIQLNGMIKEAVSALAIQASKKGIKLSFLEKSDNMASEVEGDRELLLTACEMILENAIVYGNPNSEVRVAITRADDFSEISFTNSGPGISAGDRQKIFFPFFRTEKALKTDTNRSGLGLYLANIIAKRHRGKIFFVSVPQKETTFTLRLPIVSRG